ncbi:3-methyladenine DNA glycosylase [Leucobacter luti]|uniref:3-methyladenine DNA glycosylase n=1 Tax=Leucobacter luti TaxID=340320 RepID=UPI001404D40E|nr:3-methyladenine DNA glycosylase [Leucobacter luti]QYM77347.1 3-methyladenine DNA glycosylase [Leucobacter luti]
MADAPRIAESEWRELAAAHADRADALTAGHRERTQRRERHPIEDFLWTYYSVSPGELRRWHPGAGRVLAGAGPERGGWRHYRETGAAGRDAVVDLPEFFARRRGTVDYIEGLLAATLAHTPKYGCFGLHEWAMVYRMTPEQLRHTTLPLRIGHAATDQVVESHSIGCTHFDAYRFFTPEAAPLNTLRPTRETQPALEQAGCLHAGMDVYKWAAKLGPIVPGEVLLDAFVLARDIREVDMRASPYDVTGFVGTDGSLLTPIPIETPAGKRAYARLQRGFADRGNAIRSSVLAAIAVARTGDALAMAAGTTQRVA